MSYEIMQYIMERPGMVVMLILYLGILWKIVTQITK